MTEKPARFLKAACLLIGLFLAGCMAETPLPTVQPVIASLPAPGETPLVIPTTLPEPSPSHPTRTPTTGLDMLRGIRLTFLHPWTGQLAEEIRALVDEFNVSNIWGISVSAAGTEGSLPLLEKGLLEGSDPAAAPDIAAGPADLLDQTRQAEPARFAADLSKYIQDPAWGWDAKEAADFGDGFKPVNIPAGASVPLMGSRNFLFYNRTWAAALGFKKPPATPEEFRSQVCAAAKANVLDADSDNDGTGGWIIDTRADVIYSWLLAFGAAPEGSEPGKWAFASPASLAAFDFLRKLADKNCAWVGRSDTPYEYFSKRQALLYSGTLEDLDLQKAADSRLNNSDEWIAIPYPTSNGAGLTLLTVQSLVVAKDSAENKQLAAWLFVRWLLLPRNQARLASAAALVPARPSAWELMADYRKTNIFLDGLAAYPTRPLPGQGTWRVAGMVLEDAAWQIFQPFSAPADFSRVLGELDATIGELIRR